MNKNSPLQILKAGIIDENPTFVQVVGMCPVLAVTTSASNGAGMGMATTAVLCGSNVVISLLRRFVPTTVRIPSFIVVIAGFATAIQMLLKAYVPALDKSLGIFVPLIVVNCLLLARAETYASKHAPLPSFLDGLGMGLGFTAALTIIGVIREFFGTGAILGMGVLPEAFPRTIMFILPPGAFFTLGALMALLNYVRARNKDKGAKK